MTLRWGCSMTTSDGEAPFLNVWGLSSTPLLPLLLVHLWPGAVFFSGTFKGWNGNVWYHKTMCKKSLNRQLHKKCSHKDRDYLTYMHKLTLDKVTSHENQPSVFIFASDGTLTCIINEGREEIETKSSSKVLKRQEQEVCVFCLCVYIHMFLCVYVCVCMCVCLCMYVCLCVAVFLCVCARASVDVNPCVCLCLMSSLR